MPDVVERWAAWLADPRAVDPDTGLWRAWWSPDDVGYPYEEGTAWVVRVAALVRRANAAPDLVRVAAAGAARIAEIARAEGGLGRGDRRYVFDSAVGLAALHAWGGYPRAERALLETLHAACAARIGVEAGPRAGDETADTRWSDAWGPHLLWVWAPLKACDEEAVADPAVRDLVATALRPDGAFAIHAASDRAYAHATAYACEGLLARRSVADAGRVSDALDALDANRDERGFIRAWIGEPDSPPRCDVTAQDAMIRLRARHLSAATRASATLALLESVTTAEGAVPYEPGSEHRNCWATAFALELALLAARRIV